MEATATMTKTAAFNPALIAHWLGGLGMAALIVTSYRAPNPTVIGFLHPESARLMIFHVPCHWVAFLAFFCAMWFGIRYLAKRNLADDDKSAAAAEIGLLFATVGTLTGAVFAGRQWGDNWFYLDIHEVRIFSILILLMTYAAYLALRSSFDDDERRATVCGVYSILGFVASIFLMFVLPRIMASQSLHPIDRSAYKPYHWHFMAGLLLYTWLYAWMWSLRVRAGEKIGWSKFRGVVVEQS